jgi:hypothetical protein
VPALLLIEDGALREAVDVTEQPWFRLHALLAAWRPDVDLAAFAAEVSWGRQGSARAPVWGHAGGTHTRGGATWMNARDGLPREAAGSIQGDKVALG